MEAEIAKAEPALKVAQESLKVARLNLAATRLIAPIGGRIGRPLIAVGSLVNESMPLAAIDSVDPMCVAFDVSEGTILELRRNPPHLRDGPALPVLVGLKDEKGHPRKTKVESAETRVDPATGKARWRALLPNPDGLLMPGMSVRVRLVTSDPYQALLLPFEAFFVDMRCLASRGLSTRRPNIMSSSSTMKTWSSSGGYKKVILWTMACESWKRE